MLNLDVTYLGISMYYFVDLYDEKLNFIKNIDSQTCQKVLESFNSIQELLDMYNLGKCVNDSLDSLLQWSASANRNSTYMMRNLHTAERLVRGFLFELRTCLDHIETEINHQHGSNSELLELFKSKTSDAYNSCPEYAFTYHLRNVSQHCQNVVHGFNGTTELGISSSTQRLLNEYKKWKPVDKDYMSKSGKNIDLLKTFSKAFQAFNKALSAIICYLLNTNHIGDNLLYLRNWGDSLCKQFKHDVNCYQIFELKFQNGSDATYADLSAENIMINGYPFDWDVIYELSNFVKAVPAPITK